MDNMQRFAWEFLEGGSYGANSYSKAMLMLRTLKRFMGQDLFSRMIKTYSQRFWFKHPRPEDFYAVVSEFAGRDMSWFLDQFVYGSDKLDYAVGDISSRKIRQPQGWFDGEYIKRNIKEDRYQTEVIVRRLGEVRLPVDVLIVFEDGEEFRDTWDGQYRWKKYTFQKPARIR
jgi:hypothetical protein